MRWLGLAALGLVALGLGWAAVQRGPGSDRPSVAPMAQLVGRAVQTADRGVAQVLGADGLDEARLGAELERSAPWREVPGADQDYVRAVLAEVARSAKKELRYRAWLVEDPSPNAHALPGGLVLVTTGLMSTLSAEDELACILAHEVAHVELSHGLDAAKFEIAAGKLRVEVLGEVATVLHQTLLRHTYSQAVEAEADAWALERVQASPWDPGGCARAFAALGRVAPTARTSLLREYLSSHPPVTQREAKAAGVAEAWWASHPGEARWRGAGAWRRRQTVARGPVDGEEPDGGPP